MTQKNIVFWSLILVVILFRYTSTKPKYEDGDKIRITTNISSEPVRYSFSQMVRLYGLKVYLPSFPEINYGDTVVVEGIVENEELTKVELINHKTSENILIGIRQKLLGFYKRSLPKRHFALISGMVLGSRQGIDGSFWEILRSSGTAHVVVASGMNVTLVAGFLTTIFLVFLPRKKAITAAIVGIWLYSFLAGFDAPIIRAAIMGTVAFGAAGLGRIKDSWRALFLSAAAMLIIKPAWINDLGFILSFTATASLMLFEAKVRRLIQFMPSIFREGLSTSLAAQIGVAPIIYMTFGQFNILSPIINALVLWTVAPVTIISMISGAFGLIVPGFGKLILYLIYPLTSWFIWVVEIFSK